MSDIEPMASDDESTYNDDERKNKFDGSNFKMNDFLPNQSMEYFSTTYVSNTNQNTNITNDKPNSNQQNNNDQDYSNYELFDDTSLGLSESTSDSNAYDNDSLVDDNDINDNFIPKNEELRMMYVRNFINKVEKNFKEKDTIMQGIQQEIIGCRQRLSNLNAKRDETYDKLNKAQDENNITVANRLDKEHANICNEIELETKVLEKLTETFNVADLERSKALLEKTKYALADNELKKHEQTLNRQKEFKANQRINIEQKKVDTIQKKLAKTKEIEEEKVRLENEKQKEAIMQAKHARQVTAKYLQTTLREMKEKKAEEESNFGSATELKRKELINLKNKIDHNREMFQAKLNKKKFLEMKQNQELLEEKNQILQRGENPDFYIPRKLKLEEIEKSKKKFEDDQVKQRQDIIKKILSEKENEEKKKKLYPNLFNINLKPLKQTDKNAIERDKLKKLNIIASSVGVLDDNITAHLDELVERKNTTNEDDNIEQRSINDTTTIASRDDDDDSDQDELNNSDEILVKPEFEGLWNKQLKAYNAQDLYKTNFKFPTTVKTTAEKELYLKSLQGLKKSAIKDQVAAGKKFVGVSFKSQPRIIHFKDFDVGTTYSIKVVLTNISYTINTCKFVDITEKLKDFITIDFQPPGHMSAGLTCEFNVTFEPKINKDLEGVIQFMSTNGPFSIPIQCTIKKCDLAVNTNSVYFGTIVIGEKISRKIQLTNKGALGTSFKLITLEQFQHLKNPPTPDSSATDESAIQIGQVKEGTLAPFSTVDLEFLFTPTFPGKFRENFVIYYEDPDSDDETRLQKIANQLSVSCKATSIDVPIWIENINIDLKICMYDRLYQDVLRVHNRANAALRITFEVPNELKNHLEVLPKTAFIQAKSDFLAQIKFTAKKTLAQDAPTFFDNLTGVLEVPLYIQVAEQNKTVNYNLHAIITTSDLEFDKTEIDFGYCTIYETVKATVNLTNKSILCQPFGFVKLPDFVNVQPNDGFGTLLPNETIQIDINFVPSSAKEYKFSVLCKSIVNRDFVINCRGVGVHPPLKLSSQRVNFKATSLNSTSCRTVYVCNDHVDYDQHRHPVPRIGTGEIAQVGPTYFEFDLPEKCPFKMWPTVGCVEPGKKVKVTIEYTASLSEWEVKEEAAKMIKSRMMEKANKIMSSEHNLSINSVENPETDVKPKKRTHHATSKLNKPESSLSANNQFDLNPKTPDPDSIEKGSQDYVSGLMSMINNFKGNLWHFQVPCYVSNAPEKRDDSVNLPYSIHNTLYLDVICPVIKPEIIFISKDMNTTIDFGKLPIGQKYIKKIPIKNISDSPIQLKSNILDPDGPFLLLNSLRTIEPGEAHEIIVAFIPHKNFIFHENLEIKANRSNLNFVLNGVGVEPSFSLSYDANQIDFGYCLANEKCEKIIEMKNNSKVPIEFRVNLDSSNSEHRRENEFKRFQMLESLEHKCAIGPNNYFGLSNFDVYPVQGCIPAGSKVDLKITFAPDHTSELYADTMRITMISNEKNSKVIQLHGKSRVNNMYVRGVEHLSGNLNNESMILIDLDAAEDQEDDLSKEKTTKGEKSASKGKTATEQPLVIPNSALVTLFSSPSTKTFGEYNQAEKLIQIGCMKSNSDKKDVKKNGEFSFDNIKEINAKGFNIDLTKSAVEAGGERQVKITWKPATGIDPKQSVQALAVLTTKSNINETWKLLLQGRITNEYQNG